MIDQALVKQVSQLLAPIDKKIQIRVDRCDSQEGKQLRDFLQTFVAASDCLHLEETGVSNQRPRFEIHVDGHQTGIGFEGIPGGHEFSSLVLAVMNSAGLGKLPDPGMTERIRAIKGPIDLRTFISLTCENCPDVIQSLNQIAIIHPHLTHTMVDGAVAKEEVERLNIQGVPAVFAGDSLISSGKAALLQLVERLESHFGSLPQKPVHSDLGEWDVAVIGGGPAGAAAAIYSARKGLKTAVICEKLGGQLQDTKGIENLISVPYTEGPELSQRMREHMEQYNIQILEHRRVEKVQPGEKTEIRLASGEFLATDSLIVATGASWRRLNIPGEEEYIGSGVAFCPHCDGPFFKGKDIAVIGGGNSGVEAAIDLAGIAKSVTVLEFADELKADEVLQSKMYQTDNITVLKGVASKEVMGDGQKVQGLSYQDRKTGQVKNLEVDGIFVQIGLKPNGQFVEGIVETNQYGELVVDEKGRTSQEGIYAAGDVTNSPYKQIIISMGDGAKAALASFEDRMRKSSR